MSHHLVHPEEVDEPGHRHVHQAGGHHAAAGVGEHLGVGDGPALAIIIVCNIWGKGMVKIIPILLGVLGSYVLALVMGKVDFAPIAAADLFGLTERMMAATAAMRMTLGS